MDHLKAPQPTAVKQNSGRYVMIGIAYYICVHCKVYCCLHLFVDLAALPSVFPFNKANVCHH